MERRSGRPALFCRRSSTAVSVGENVGYDLAIRAVRLETETLVPVVMRCYGVTNVTFSNVTPCSIALHNLVYRYTRLA